MGPVWWFNPAQKLVCTCVNVHLHFFQRTRLWLAHAPRLALWLAIGLWALSWPGPSAWAQPPSAPLILSSGAWKDDSGQASVDQARQQTFSPFKGEFSGGYTTGASWLRIGLAATANPMALRISPPWVDEITLFDPAQPGVQLTAGDRHPQGITAEQMLAYVFILPASAEPRELLIQLRSTSSHKLMIEAMTEDQLPAASNRAMVWISVYAALMFIILLALLSVWLVQPEMVLGAYVIRHAFYSMYAITFLGLPHLLFAEAPSLEPLDSGFSLLVILILPVALWFDIVFLKTYRPQPHLLKAMQGLALGSLIFLVMFLLGHDRLALELTVQVVLLCSLVVFAAAWSTRPDPAVQRLMSKRIMMSYYVLVSSSLLLGIPGVLGWIDSPGWMRYLLILHGLVSGVAMTVILFVRGQRLHRNHQQMALKLQRAEEEADLERHRHQEQSQFLHMLMHELKTPLAVVSLALGTQTNREKNLAHASRAVQDMKDVLDRCVQADQIGELGQKQNLETIVLSSAVAQVSQAIGPLGSRLHLQAGASLPSVRSDLQLLKIVLTNLLDNAARYSDPLTPVVVAIEAARQAGREGLSVRVCNTPGLAGRPDEQLLFSKYYRASGAQRDSGSGLGLYLSRRLAGSLGGSLQYKPGDGLVEFELWIPLIPA